MNTKKLMELYDIKGLVSKVVGKVQDVVPLTRRNLNTVFKIVAPDKNYLLKVAPGRDENVLSYEKNLMQNEYNLMDMLGRSAKVDMPEVVYKDFSMQKIDAELLLFELSRDTAFMSELALTDKERGNIMFEVGEQIARIHGVGTGASFGYSHQNPHPNWRDAFIVMFNGIVDDCKKYNVKIPYHRQAIEYINGNLTELETVMVPSIVHGGICPESILVDRGTKIFVGIVDFENGYFGDLAGDFISLDYADGIGEGHRFIEGYRNVRPLELTGNFKVRMNMLRLYRALVFAAGKKLKSPAVAFSGKTMIKNVVKGRYA